MPEPDAPTTARRPAAAWSTRRWNVPTVWSSVKATGEAGALAGGAGAGTSGSRRCGARTRVSAMTTAAAPRARAVGASVVGRPTPLNWL